MTSDIFLSPSFVSAFSNERTNEGPKMAITILRLVSSDLEIAAVSFFLLTSLEVIQMSYAHTSTNVFGQVQV